MKFMFMDRVSPGSDEAAMPNDEQMEAMGAYLTAHEDKLVSTEGLTPTSQGVRVRLSEDGETAVSRGPFPDTISNYAVLEVESEEAAIAQATSWLKIWGKGETEIRRVVTEEDLAAMQQ